MKRKPITGKDREISKFIQESKRKSPATNVECIIAKEDLFSIWEIKLKSMRKILIYCMGIILIGSCVKYKHVAHKISIEINAENEIKVEGEIIPREDLQDVLTRRIAEIEADNVQRDSIVTSIRIDKRAQMGTVTDLVQTMRALRLSNIEYTDTIPEVQGFLPDRRHRVRTAQVA